MHGTQAQDKFPSAMQHMCQQASPMVQGCSNYIAACTGGSGRLHQCQCGRLQQCQALPANEDLTLRNMMAPSSYITCSHLIYYGNIYINI